MRLTLFYSLATFVLITLIAFFLYGTTVHILHRANYQFLSNEMDILTNLLKKESFNFQVLEQKVIEVPYTETGSVYHYFIRIVDEQGKLVIETPKMRSILNKVQFFNIKTFPTEKESTRWDYSNKQNYLLIKAPAVYAKTNKVWMIQIALDISYQQRVINNYQTVLLLCLIIGTFFAIFLGYIIARQGMHSLYELTQATKKITASSLHQQIDPQSWPKELKALGKAFNQMLERIETSFSQLIEFSADLAHELRTPVNNIMGQTEILLSRKCSLDEYQQVLGSNLEELQRISQIIDNLLFLSRTENIQLEIKKTELDVEKEVKLVGEFYQPVADEKNIQIEYEGHARLNANSIMFRRMISNIISNALNYTAMDGKIYFKIIDSPAAVDILIKDTGMGIAPEHLPKIFNRFYRIDAARSQNSGGTGLGLAIVKSIVELHGGLISLASDLGKGTEVLIKLPK